MLPETKKRLYSIVHVLAAACFGAVFLLSHSLLIKTILTFFFIAAYILQGGRFKLLPNIFLITGITIVNLLNPSGEILFSLKYIAITENALRIGITKSMTFIGLIYLSRLIVSTHITKIAQNGGLLSAAFFYFEKLTEMNFRNRKESVLQTIDNYLMTLESMEDE